MSDVKESNMEVAKGFYEATGTENPKEQPYEAWDEEQVEDIYNAIVATVEDINEVDGEPIYHANEDEGEDNE